MKRTDSAILQATTLAQVTLREVLAGAQPSWPDQLQGRETLFHRLCAFHGLRVIVYERMQHAITWQSWPESLRQALFDDSQHNRLLTLRREYETGQLLKAFDQAGIRSLLLKGAAISRSRYPQPHWRERSDTDVWVAPQQRDAAFSILEQHGWTALQEVREPVSYQLDFLHEDGLQLTHAIDLHWRLSNMQAFAWSLDFEVFHAAAIDVPGKYGRAAVLAPPHALLHACIHRLSRPQAPLRQLQLPAQTEERLIGLEDIRLLTASLSAEDWQSLLGLCQRQQLFGVLQAGLVAASRIAALAMPDEIAEQIRQASRQDEPAKAYLQGGARRYWADWRHLPGPGLKYRWLRVQALPSARHLRLKYQTDSKIGWLPLYLRWWRDAMRRLLDRKPA